MKKIIPKLLTNLYAVPPEQIISVIKQTNCKVVSFDIFDTLLKRSVTVPSDVFALLEKRFQEEFQQSAAICDIRSHAEAKAIRKMGHRNVTLQEIYQAMDEVAEADRKWLMTEEIHIEQAVCQRWNPMGQVYDWCTIRKIPILLVSDMYLSREVIKRLLTNAGYKDWRSLYISSEEQASKESGKLFDIVLNKELLKPEEIVHIGDSLWRDYLQPRKKGIQAILVAQREADN